MAVLEINLDQVAANWRLLRGRHPQGATAAVVKANGYGLGAAEISRRLHAEGCRHFFTAHWGEALAVRGVLPGALLAVLNGLGPEADTADYLAHDITPVLNSLADVAAWRKEAERRNRALPALLQIDTGMNRLGLDAKELQILSDDPEKLRGIELLFIMTHLASPEDRASPENAAQLRRFQRACAALPPAPRSLPASSGMFLGPDYASDLARPGAALYGVNPTPGEPNPMGNPVRLLAQVLQVRDIRENERVGYNGIWRAPRPTRIATLAVGYADGFLRYLSNRAFAYFDGQPAPLVGRVSMDLTTYDVTDLPGVSPGAWLELLGPHQTPDQLADLAGTNGYEILTQLGSRYERRYLPVGA